MGKGRGSGKAGKRDRESEGEPPSLQVRESRIPGAIPRFEIPGWQERYGVTAGITGRDFDLGLWSKQPVGEVMSRWLSLRRAMTGFHAVALGNQIHGVEIVTLDSGRGWLQMEGIDGWITRAPGILLTVTVADCIPVYLVAPGKGVALLHAGWRGTAGGILTRGIRGLSQATGCSVSEIVIHCGVGICGPCYEVGSEVMTGCGVAAEGAGPWHLDLRERLVDEARRLGSISISSSAWCSAHDRTSFYSHRASGGTDGRMVAYAGVMTTA